MEGSASAASCSSSTDTLSSLQQPQQPHDGAPCQPTVYACATCLACERVRAACARLGALAEAPDALALPPCPPPPAPPNYLVTQPFSGDLFDAAHRAKYRVLGPTAVLQLAEREDAPPSSSRPLYSLAMRGAVICFTGFRKKDELTYLITLIHYMGGSIRKDMSAKVTHLIANAAGGDKYRYASAFRLPVLSRSWVDASWERRDNPNCMATDDAFINEHRLKVFAGVRVCFVGFPEDECQHMADVLAKNGGEACSIDDAGCTHVVMANGESFGRSLILSPNQITSSSPLKVRVTPSRSQSTPKTSLYRRLSAKLSGCRSSPNKTVEMECDPEKEREQKIQSARERLLKENQRTLEKSHDVVDFSFSPRNENEADVTKTSSHHSGDGVIEKENRQRTSSQSDEKLIMSVKEKREVFKNKTNVVEYLSDNMHSIRSPLVKSLCELDSKDDADLFLPSLRGASELQESTTTISSGKKRSRNSTDSNIQVSAVYENLSPDKCEEGTWKSIKRLKIKDSFKFKNRPAIFKRDKKIPKPSGDVSIEQVSPDISKPSDPANLYSSPSPTREDDNTSICSMNTSKQSGFFDISFASINSKTVKSASKLRRQVKSFTASFRSERKKKYEKRVECTSMKDIAPENSVSTPKRELNQMTLDLSPVELDMVDTSILSTPVRQDNMEDSLMFKTPQPLPRAPAVHRHSICGGAELSQYIASLPRPNLAPSPSGRDHQPQPRDALAISQTNGLLLSVVDEHSTATLPECAPRVQVVKAEWFWASVQNEEAQDEKEYLFKDYLEEASRRSSVSAAAATGEAGVSPAAGPGGTPSGNSGAGSTPAQLQRLRKRKFRGSELKEALLNKRRSSVGDAVLLSLSGNLLDCTPSPDGKQLLQEAEVTDNVVRKLMSPRQQVFMELLQTESNYVGILHTIVTMFKQPLEQMAEEDMGEEEGGSSKTQPLLNNTELKIIFGNLSPIYELHRRMLEELKYASTQWSEEVSIGRLVLKYTPDMVKAYPPFVNFFENTKEMLQQCDRDNPRFHAFLKICQTRAECGRQSLQELLIRPVQRLPSISLLINDILKHTHKNNPDHGALVSALAGLREAMSHINEDKRKTEGQLQMFDIYNDIDQCPPHLVSSHRSFVSRCEVVELSRETELSGRGDHLVLFLFTDTMEVCKKRSKAFNSKSPTGSNGTSGAAKLGSCKPYRHVSLLPLSTVKRVVDIRESEDCQNVFALMCRSNQELKEKLYSFMITDESVDKATFLRQLCRQMANTVCKADADKFLACLERHQLQIDTSDLAHGTLSKAFKFASRTRLKVGRALSFNKTPSKLKRAMSSMISPFGSASNLTPASQLAQMRLASCNNIHEVGTSSGGAGGGGQEVLMAPLSVQPTRKAAGAAAALRRF